MSVASISPMNFKGSIGVIDAETNRSKHIIKTKDLRSMERVKFQHSGSVVDGTKIEYTHPKTKSAVIAAIPEKLETVLLAYNAVKDTEACVNFYA